jgi:chemotaxis protein MotB
MKFYRATYILISVTFFTSCVPISKFNEVKKKSDACIEEGIKSKAENEKLLVANTEQKSLLERLSKDNEKLIKDSLLRYQALKQLQLDFNKLDRSYSDLQVAQENLSKGSARETTKLLSQLQTTQEDLQKREDMLRKTEWSLDEKKKELEKRDIRLKELESVLQRKDSAVNALKTKVSSALLGFENNGLTVKIRNGKVYVSLEDKLLFKSGSSDVNQSGTNALKKLSKVLEQNNDINVMIEGHTDDVPYRSDAAVKDNWDLSVKRATAVVRILLDGSNIDAKRLTASGRSEYFPIEKAKTPEARQKNRRTEIILTPKLDELFKILENN